LVVHHKVGSERIVCKQSNVYITIDILNESSLASGMKTVK
jgi:hypothetical protein